MCSHMKAAHRRTLKPQRVDTLLLNGRLFARQPLSMFKLLACRAHSLQANPSALWNSPTSSPQPASTQTTHVIRYTLVACGRLPNLATWILASFAGWRTSRISYMNFRALGIGNREHVPNQCASDKSQLQESFSQSLSARSLFH